MEEIAARREALRQFKKEIESGERTLDSLNLNDASAVNEEESKQNESEYEFLAFARVLSGRLHKGQTLFVLSPKHNPNDFIGQVNQYVEIYLALNSTVITSFYFKEYHIRHTN